MSISWPPPSSLSPHLRHPTGPSSPHPPGAFLVVSAWPYGDQRIVGVASETGSHLLQDSWGRKEKRTRVHDLGPSWTAAFICSVMFCYIIQLIIYGAMCHGRLKTPPNDVRTPSHAARACSSKRVMSCSIIFLTFHLQLQRYIQHSPNISKH